MCGWQHPPLRVRPACKHFCANQLLPLQGKFGLVIGLELSVVQALLHIVQRGELCRRQHFRRGAAVFPIAFDHLAETFQVERLTQVAQESQAQTVDHRDRGLTQRRVQFAA
ncbi:hypothetical protein D3C80_1393240 [compost metagenome]